MTSLALLRTDSFVTSIDPRFRLVAAFAWAVLLALAQRWETVLAGLVLAAAVCAAARLPWSGLKMRLAGLNLFMLMLVVTLPWSVPGTALVEIGPFDYSREGLDMAARVALKGNAILLILSAWVSTIEVAALGHALEHLHFPKRLVHLFLFTVRYLEQTHFEYLRLVRAARARGFAPRMDRHTWRTYAQWIGMLFIRGLDRSERVLAAMKARGYKGQFYLLKHFKAGARDAVFGAAAMIGAAGLIWLEWM